MINEETKDATEGSPPSSDLWNAIDLLARIGKNSDRKDELVSNIDELLEEENPWLKISAIWILGHMGELSGQNEAQLKKLIEDENQQVSSTARFFAEQQRQKVMPNPRPQNRPTYPRFKSLGQEVRELVDRRVRGRTPPASLVNVVSNTDRPWNIKTLAQFYSMNPFESRKALVLAYECCGGNSIENSTANMSDLVRVIGKRGISPRGHFLSAKELIGSGNSPQRCADILNALGVMWSHCTDKNMTSLKNQIAIGVVHLVEGADWENGMIPILIEWKDRLASGYPSESDRIDHAIGQVERGERPVQWDDVPVRSIDIVSFSGSLTLSNDSTRLVYRRSFGGDYRVINLDSGEEKLLASKNIGARGMQPDYRGPTSKTAISSDGRWLAGIFTRTRANTRALMIRNVDKTSSWIELEGDATAIRFADFSPDPNQIMTAGIDGKIRLWDLSTKKEIREFADHGSPIDSFQISREGGLIASGGRDQTIKIWSANDGKLIQSVDTKKKSINGLALAADGKLVASLSRDKLIRIWNIENGELIASLRGHLESITRIFFVSDSSHLISAARDGTIRVWNCKTGNETLIRRKHAGLSDIEYWTEKEQIISVGVDRKIKFWDWSRDKNGRKHPVP